MGRVKWDQRELDREVERAMEKLLSRLGIRGEAIAKNLISGKPDPELKAVDTGRLRASLTHEVVPSKSLVRIGTNVKYAPFVFAGTPEGKPGMTRARPILRRMLMQMRAEGLVK